MNKYSFFGLLIIAFIAVVGLTAPQVSAQSSGDVTINVMKHICNVEIQSVADFNDVDVNNDGETAFTDKVLSCPTVLLEGDAYVDGAVSFFGGENHDFDFQVEDDDGNEQFIDDATLVNQQVCEAEEPDDPEANTVYLGADVNGDGEMNACLDTSLYSYEGVAAGDITVREFESPTGKIGGALEFTPAALNGGFDESVTLSDDGDRFRGGVVELDSSEDNDGVITLHLYNFQPTDAELALQLGEARADLLALLASLQTTPAFPNTGDGSLE